MIYPILSKCKLSLSRAAIGAVGFEDLVKDKRWACISVMSDAADLPSLKEINPDDDPNCLGILQLVFDDIDIPREGYHRMTWDDADKIWRFVLPLENVLDVLVVHCLAGQCRSPAISAAVSKVLRGTDQEYFNRYCPNRLVYSTLLEVFHLKTETYLKLPRHDSDS